MILGWETKIPHATWCRQNQKPKKHMARNSLIAWWSGLGAFIALPWVQSLLQELRSFKPSGAAKKKKKRKEKSGGSGVQDGEHMYTHG